MLRGRRTRSSYIGLRTSHHMSREQVFLLAITLAPLALVLFNKLRLDVAALAMSAALGLAQLGGYSIFGPPNTPHDAVKAIAGFSQPVIVTLFSLFVLTGATEKSGAARWLAAHVVACGGDSERRLIVLFAGAAAVLSIFMNNVAAAALVLPSAVDASRRTGVKTSKLLIPVAYGSLLGGAATYFTTANIIVSDLLTSANPPQQPLHVLDFTPIGGLIALAGILFLGFFGPRLLPSRDPKPEQILVRRSGIELARHYGLPERLWELRVKEGPVRTAGSRTDWALPWRLFGAEKRPSSRPLRRKRSTRTIWFWWLDARSGFGRSKESRLDAMTTRGMKGVMLIETMIAPQSQLEGRTLRELEFRKHYRFTAVALLRQQRSYRTDVATFKLQPGDSLLLVGAPDRLSLLRKVTGLIVFEPHPSDLPIRRGMAIASVGILAAAIIASIAGVPVFLATLVGAIAIFLTGLFSVEEAYASIPWQALFLIAGMYSVSLAMIHTGLASMVSDAVVGWIAPYGAIGLAAGAYLLSALLTQIIGGQVGPSLLARSQSPLHSACTKILRRWRWLQRSVVPLHF